FAQARIPELVAPRIDEPALRPGRGLVRQDLALDAAVADGGEIVAGRPDARREFLAEEVAAARETLEGDVPVAEIFVAHRVEIVLSAGDRQRRAPPVLHPLVFDVASGLEAADLVRTRAERNVERGFV